MTARRCSGTTRKGTPCKSPPLRDAATCLAHAGEETRGSMRFGGPQPGGGRPRVPRATDLQRQLVEQHARTVIRPYFRSIGLDIDEDGNVTHLDRGAIHVGRDKEGGVHTSTVEDLSAQVAAAEALLNRVYGRPRQALEHTGAGGGPIAVDGARVDLRKLSDDELELLERILTHAAPDA
jgi:hypothetical protein